MKKYIENWRKFLLKETRIVIISEDEEEMSNIDEGEETQNPKHIEVGDKVRASDGETGKVTSKPHKSSGSLWQVLLDSGVTRRYHRVTKLANQTKK